MMVMGMASKTTLVLRQYNLQNRWYWKSGSYILHAGLSLLKEDRTSGQVDHHGSMTAGMTPYRINIGTNRYEAYMKNAFILDPAHGTNIALMGNGFYAPAGRFVWYQGLLRQ